MATAKKPAAKKEEQTFAMPVEVKDWIDQASSRMNHMRSEIDRLKEENKQLRRSHKLMEQRVMGMSLE
jgi:hypothetical protein